MSANLLRDDIDKQPCLPESGCCTQMDTEQLVGSRRGRDGDQVDGEGGRRGGNAAKNVLKSCLFLKKTEPFMAVYNAGLFYFISNYSRMIKEIILYQDISQNVLICIRDIPND